MAKWRPAMGRSPDEVYRLEHYAGTLIRSQGSLADVSSREAVTGRRPLNLCDPAWPEKSQLNRCLLLDGLAETFDRWGRMGATKELAQGTGKNIPT